MTFDRLYKLISESVNDNDEYYLELAKNPEENKDILQRMVDEAAKKAGYDVKVWQAVWGGKIVGDRFDPKYIGVRNGSSLSQIGYMFSSESRVAKQFGGEVLPFFLKADNLTRLKSLDGSAWAAKEAIKDGADVVLWENVIDGWSGPSDIYLVAPGRESQIKSADPITYDDAGNIIPLFQRFDSSKDDIRY